jgi:hypothetical protein
MQVREDYATLVGRYERLYREGKPKGLGKGRGGTVASYDVPGLVALCERLALIASNEYLRCMWARRKHLHATRQHGRVYDGTDAVKWVRAMRRAGAA